MKKITRLLSVGFISFISVTAMACPKGTTLTGGTGPNHKGGTCVPVNAQKLVADANSKAAAEAHQRGDHDARNKAAQAAKDKAVQDAKAKAAEQAAKERVARNIAERDKAAQAAKERAARDQAQAEALKHEH